MRITDWPADERPREKLLQRGAESLSDAELLAIFLRVGVTGVSAVDLARQLLQRFGSLNALFAASQDEVSSVRGLGAAKYAQLQAVLEMARRSLLEDMQQQPVLGSVKTVKQYLGLRLGRLPREVVLGLFLDSQHRLIQSAELARGTLDQCVIYPREVAQQALACHAASLILAHNHPSGRPDASPADHQLTRMLQRALHLLDIRLLDHVIVAGNQSLSFAEQGWLLSNDTLHSEENARGA